MGSARLLCPWGFPGKKTEVSCHSLLQGDFNAMVKGEFNAVKGEFNAKKHSFFFGLNCVVC